MTHPTIDFETEVRTKQLNERQPLWRGSRYIGWLLEIWWKLTR